MMRNERLLACALQLAIITLGSGCYDPVIKDGAQQCGPNNSCPEGMKCFPDHHCYQPEAKPTCAPACTGQNPKCDPMTLKCVQCLAAADCPAGMLCVSQVCKPGCA